VLAEALATLKQTRECNYEAELYRLRGELLLMMGDEGEAEASFQHAIELARQQHLRRAIR
jgi:predicted negative regulator of RcsB-dependent stress response